MSEHSKEEFEAALASFVEKVQALKDEDIKQYVHLKPDQITVDPGGIRYIRIVATGDEGRGQRMVWGFVERVTGNIFKPEGWKKPAKHSRGNIFNENPLDGCNAFGPRYLR